eukprot:g3359.t1
MAFWLEPTCLVEEIPNGFFKLNDRNPAPLHSRVATWNDLEFPKTIANVCSDQYRISKVSCYFEGLETQFCKLMALQLEYTSILKDDEEVITGALIGVKRRHIPWTQDFTLESNEHLTGISVIAECKDIRLKTSTGRTVSMVTGLPFEDTSIWELPPGFRIYGFHGTFDGQVMFLGPIFKAMEFKQWDQNLYSELPGSFKHKIELMLLVKHRHQAESPDADFINFWTLPESVWDQIVNQLLYSFYHDADPNRFFTGIQYFLIPNRVQT